MLLRDVKYKQKKDMIQHLNSKLLSLQANWKNFGNPDDFKQLLRAFEDLKENQEKAQVQINEAHLKIKEQSLKVQLYDKINNLAK